MTTKNGAAVAAILRLGVFIIIICYFCNAHVHASDVNNDSIPSPQRQSRPQRETQPEAYQERLVAWLLEDPNGFFHPALRWRRLGRDGAGPYSLHAARDIPQGTPLIVLPRSYVIESHEPERSEANDAPDDPRMCTTVQRMVREYDKVTKEDEGDRKHEEEVEDGGEAASSTSSSYAPYLSYLFDEAVGGTSPGLLPTAWSPEAKRILRLILGDEDSPIGSLEPEDFEYPHVYDVCPDHDFDSVDDDGSDDDGSERKRHVQDAYLFLLSRGWKDKLLPVVDFFNHRNGGHRNTEVTSVRDRPGAEAERDDVAAYAWRDVKAGEQLQLSYSECLDACCEFGDIKYIFDTPEIFKHYGFVEFYPRRWTFEVAQDYEDYEDEDSSDDFSYKHVVVEVTAKAEAENGDGKRTLNWIYETPDEASLHWLGQHLERLRSVEATVRTGVAALRAAAAAGAERRHNLDHEAEQLAAWYEAHVEVLALALERRDAPVAVTREEHAATVRYAKETDGQRSVDDLRRDHASLLSRYPRSETTTAGAAANHNGAGTDEL